MQRRVPQQLPRPTRAQRGQYRQRQQFHDFTFLQRHGSPLRQFQGAQDGGRAQQAEADSAHGDVFDLGGHGHAPAKYRTTADLALR